MSRTHSLKVADDAVELAAEVYRVTALLPHEETYGLKSQMRRAAVSVASNIAEGAHRRSDKDFARFIAMSEGSLAELAIQARVVRRLQMLDASSLATCQAQIRRLERRLVSLRGRLNADTLAKQ